MDMVTAQQRTMKDFLELYNKLVHHCFDKCISNFNHAKTSEEEMNCVNICTDKCIFFNQRHMMVFVEHQNAKQKLAAKASETQVLSTSASLGAAGISTGTENSGQGVAILAESQAPALVPAGGRAEETVPKNVCRLSEHIVKPQYAILQPRNVTHYTGKSVVDQFLGSDPDCLKFV